jgi:hypothetical protein
MQGRRSEAETLPSGGSKMSQERQFEFFEVNLRRKKAAERALPRPPEVGVRTRHATVALIAEHLKLISERQERHTPSLRYSRHVSIIKEVIITAAARR